MGTVTYEQRQKALALNELVKAIDYSKVYSKYNKAISTSLKFIEFQPILCLVERIKGRPEAINTQALIDGLKSGTYSISNPSKVYGLKEQKWYKQVLSISGCK